MTGAVPEQGSGRSEKLLWSDDLDLPRLPPLDRPGTRTAKRIQTDPERLERSMAQLVLTVIELLRQLMERQALRRVEHGSLTPEQEESVGTALMRLAETMDEMKEKFDLDDEDLNLHLGPLGDLL